MRENASDVVDLPVSLVIVSDFEAGEKTWADEILCVEAFLSDRSALPAEVIIVESSADGHEAPAPPELMALSNRLRIVYAPYEESARLKDHAVPLAQHDCIAVVEADCLPGPGWLAHLYKRMEAPDRPDIVSGRTAYPEDTPLQRVMTLLDRGFAEIPVAPDFAHVSNNGALYRKEVLERFPYPEETRADMNPFVSAERRQHMFLDAGVKTAFAVEAVCYHAFGGWDFIKDVRRNKGFQYALGAKHPVHTEDIKVSSIGTILTALQRSIRADLSVSIKRGWAHLKLWDWPLLVFVLAAVRPAEAAGAMMAKRPDAMLEGTAYR
ncbi:MAG: glycosyltransferase [Pseudomonadota bacterium]